jgi:hypothetical protein
VKKGQYGFDVPDGIIAHLTRECGGNVHNHHVVEVTSGSFEKETESTGSSAENAADLETRLFLQSAFRSRSDAIPLRRNN